jgi:uncharacterized RmlC-like cupin family protein
MNATQLHDQYLEDVALRRYPEDPEVPMPPGFSNEAGEIVNVLFARDLEIKITSVALIHSVAGAIRSNHFHKTDWHFMIVVGGEMHYYWRTAGSSEEPRLKVFKPGQLMFTPPFVEHATYFPVPTTILTLARNVRNHYEHENDLVRVPLIKKAGKGVEFVR